MKILLIEDSPIIVENISQAFREARYAVDAALTAVDGLWLAKEASYDAIILDWMLPDQSGIDILEQLRDSGIETPVVMLTARDETVDKIKGLNTGADDYMTKPFDLGELLARVSALIRRTYKQQSNVINICDLSLDRDKRSVHRGNKPIELSAREYALLEYLCLREGHIVSRSDIYDHIYAFENDSASNVVDVYIGYLRKKIQPKGFSPLIHTHRGQGYRIGNDA